MLAMSETDRNFSEVPEVAREQKFLEECREIIESTTPLIIDKLLLINGNKPSELEGLLNDILNFAYRIGMSSISERRLASERHKVDPFKDLHKSPDAMTARQDTTIHAQKAVLPLIRQLPELLEKRAKLVAEGKSPLQKPSPSSLPGGKDNIN